MQMGNYKGGRVRRIGVMLAALAVVLVIPVSAGAADHSEIVSTFDAEAGQLSEGVAVDKTGNVFVSLAPLGQLLKFAPGSSEYEVFGSIPGWAPDGEGAGFLGLAVDARGNVYGAAQWTGATGVWKFDRRSGEATLIPGTEAAGFPNSLAFDKRGTLYFTDSFSNGDEADPLGAVWRIGRNGHVEKWLESKDIAGTGAFGIGPVGANGISYRKATLYVAVAEQFSIVSIDVRKNGSAGNVSTVAAGLELGGPDGIALDVHGNIYVAAITDNAVKRVNRDGSIEVLAAGAEDGLDLPSSVAFGTGAGMKQTLYAVNLALIPALGTGVGPALVAIDVGVPGLPLP